MDPGLEPETASGWGQSLTRSRAIEVRRKDVVEVEQWAELRRLHFAEGVSIRELRRRTGLGRNTIRRALRREEPPRYTRRPGTSKLDPFKEEINHLLRSEPRLPGVRVVELVTELGYAGSKTLVYDHLREVRPLFAPTRTFQRTAYRRGELLQFDLLHLAREVPVGHGQTRKSYLVVAALGYSRAGAGALIFSREAVDILAGLWRCIERLGALPRTLVIDREGALHGGRGRPTEPFAAFCGQLGVGWHFCEPADPQAKGIVERLQGYMRTSFEPGRRFANHLDCQDQLDRWFENRANLRIHRTLRRAPAEMLAEERGAMRALPERPPDVERRFVMRVGPDPYVRIDTNDYSLDPALVGRRVEVRVDQRRLRAAALHSGEIAARHERCFARHRTITAPAHAAALAKGEPCDLGRAAAQVETRPLSRYDALIPA
jgi:transposase